MDSSFLCVKAIVLVNLYSDVPLSSLAKCNQVLDPWNAIYLQENTPGKCNNCWKTPRSELF